MKKVGTNTPLKKSPKAKAKVDEPDVGAKAKVDEPDVGGGDSSPEDSAAKVSAVVPAVRRVTRSSTRAERVPHGGSGTVSKTKVDPLEADVKKWSCPVCTIVLQDYTTLLHASDSSIFECTCCGTLLEVDCNKKFTFVVAEKEEEEEDCDMPPPKKKYRESSEITVSLKKGDAIQTKLYKSQEGRCGWLLRDPILPKKGRSCTG